MSYYPKWSSFSIDELSVAIDSLIGLYNKELMVEETSYPYTLEEADSAGNILGKDVLIEKYPQHLKGS